MQKKITVWILLSVFQAGLLAQNPVIDSLKNELAKTKLDSNRVKILLQVSSRYFNASWPDAEAYAVQALELSGKINYPQGKAIAYKNVGVIKYYNGQPALAVNAWDSAMHYYKIAGDKQGLANVLGNLGGVYTQSNQAKALEYNLEALQIAEDIKDSFRITTLLINIGALYDKKETTIQKALESYRQAIQIASTNNYSDALGMATSNIGNIYLNNDKVDSALYYFKIGEKNLAGNPNLCVALNNMGTAYRKSKDYEAAKSYHEAAYKDASRSDNKLYMSYALLGLAEVAKETGKLNTAFQHFQEAEKLGVEIGADNILLTVYGGLAESHAKNGDYNRAYSYSVKLAEVRQRIFNKDTEDKLGKLQFDFDLQKKQDQIELLSAEKELQHLALERQRSFRNSLLAGIGLIAAFLFITFRGYRQKQKLSKILINQKAEIESLLNNMLPMEVSQELRAKGSYQPRFYDNTSVMFTDYQSFTKLTETLSPQSIVEELNYSFKKFDEIIEKYGLEKIKTIGDAYMCAAGIPTPSTDHHWRIVKAAKEILAFVEERNIERKKQGENIWKVRIGINAGPMVAGVIGNKKLTYDVWGNAVNIASRMETNGEPGQINISSSFYELIKDRYHCTHRGKIHAKNVGDIDMYFLGEEIK
jgi:adenylate cyclase